MAVTEQTFIKRLHFVLHTLSRYKLKINFTKLMLGTYTFSFLGAEYNLKDNYSSIKLDRREALLAYREPRSFAEILSRTASLNYNSRFLPGLQKFLIPLLHLSALADRVSSSTGTGNMPRAGLTVRCYSSWTPNYTSLTDLVQDLSYLML